MLTAPKDCPTCGHNKFTKWDRIWICELCDSTVFRIPTKEEIEAEKAKMFRVGEITFDLLVQLGKYPEMRPFAGPKFSQQLRDLIASAYRPAPQTDKSSAV